MIFSLKSESWRELMNIFSIACFVEEAVILMLIQLRKLWEMGNPEHEMSFACS